LIALATASGACSKAPSGPRSDAGPPSAAAAPAIAKDASPPAPEAVARWSGTYASAPATLYIPTDWKGVHWKVPETAAGVGDGALTVTVDPSTGRVSGAVDGPLGPARVEGVVSDGGVAAMLSRKDPSDRGFTGTMVGSISGDTLTGSLHVSAAEASAVRSATFTLKPARGDNP